MASAWVSAMSAALRLRTAFQVSKVMVVIAGSPSFLTSYHGGSPTRCADSPRNLLSPINLSRTGTPPGLMPNDRFPSPSFTLSLLFVL